MKRKLALIGIVISLFLLYQPPVKAVCSGQTFTPSFFAKESLTISTTALPGTATVYNPSGAINTARYAFVTVETNPIRYWLDGSVPTAFLGHLVATNGSFEVCGINAVRNFQMIRQGAADATVMISYAR